MAKIFSAPNEIKTPQLDFANTDAYEGQWKEFEEKLREWCLKRKNEKYVGKIISFPVADGSAMYMVASMKPVELIEMDYLDGYQFQYVHLLTAKEVKEQIDLREQFEKAWANAKQANEK